MKKSTSLSEHTELSDYTGQTIIVYDGDCPFCSRYIAWHRLRESIGPVTLENARDGGKLAQILPSAGYDLNEGMVLIWNNRIYHGDSCIHHLALLSSDSGLFNKVNAAIFRSKWLSTFLYPILRTGRKATLWIMGRTKIDV